MKYFIYTYGCQMNISDSEKIAAKLKRAGHRPAKTAAEADLVVLNACSVRQSAMHRVLSQLHKFRNKKIILAGCVLPADKKRLTAENVTFWHPDDYFSLTPLRQNKFSAFVPVMTGCNNFCSYCVVPFTRGQEKSRPATAIIKEIKTLLKNGAKEIILLGQNVNSYRDKKTDFAQLLKKIDNLPGNFRLNFITSHPKDMSDKLIKTLAECKKLVKELHLPVQSGDNAILRRMNRGYNAKRYLDLLKKIRRAIPDIKISTDIIVGFPDETKKQFQNTLKLAQAAKFNNAFIAKYSPRPGTAAAKFKDNVPADEKKRRWRILDTLINGYEH